MFPFSSPSPAPEPDAAAPADKSAHVHPLDALTGGAFSAATSGERSARIRDWLATNPDSAQMQEVFKELSTRDKGAAKAIRERLEEQRRALAQQAMAAEWAARAQALLDAPRLHVADALAWQRDAARAGAPLSREPLQTLKTRLAERVKAVEDLQHRVQVQREAAVLMAQRIEVLSTKPWREAQAAHATLAEDVARWRQQAQEIVQDPVWPSVDLRFAPQLEAAQTQLGLVWDAFGAALTQAAAASEDPKAPLPQVPVWAEELRAARGGATSASAAEPARAAPHPERIAQAVQAVTEALTRLEGATAQGRGKASVGAAQQLRAAWKAHGRFVDAALEARVHAALTTAGELEGWQRWSADQIREELVAKAQGLLQRPEGQALGGRRLQEQLRQLREQWKQADQGALANHALWKKFDEACNAAHKQVEEWLEKSRAQALEHKTQRLALIEELKAWGAEHARSSDWKMQIRALHQFGERWRASGHVGEKLFAELQPQWKQALAEAGAPLAAAQKQNLQERQALIDEAVALGAAPQLRTDAVKALQQRWQALAQAVPLERRQEQKLWDAFRSPIDAAFERKSAERERSAAALSAHDAAVLQASRALDAANASGDAEQIRLAMQQLQAVMQGRPSGAAGAESEQKPVQTPADTADPATTSEDAGGDTAPAAPADGPAAPTAPRRVVAVRGDDRPDARKPATPAPTARKPGGPRADARSPRAGGERFGRERPERSGRPERGPRLGDTAFRAQREAVEQAQMALRKLAAQAHGEALNQLLQAWQQRDAAMLPAARELGRGVNTQAVAAWAKALQGGAQATDPQALLRLEIAADVPTPAEHHDARRALQLQLLTRRNEPGPGETWPEDTARVLAGPADRTSGQRLQAALKVLLRK
ncbi:DUF349 domain-containing protein [Comamonas sp. NLF-1-9]|uniref:DUF349 domain-containing protein n=1 Tax=Comamonas sp. NLF-1-9 TaxID=2853163 RepID=UPI001C43F6F2|nr:DUF349 domain-containing protein [Comamonas sp. NLF-1-9]QXL85256.1 DUF349 domain-containing protein [Comamonas sp. NLF-1-9]